MKQLKRISLWRRIAIVLCFVLAIGAGVAGALIPQMNGAFAENETRAATSISVTWTGGTLEKNVTSTEYNQLKEWLHVTDQGSTEIKDADYDVTDVTYQDDAHTAIVTVTGKGAYAGLTATSIPITTEAIKYQGLEVKIPDTFFVNGEYIAPKENSNGYYQLGENHLIYFSDMTPEAVLSSLDVSICYQHIKRKIEPTYNPEDGTVSGYNAQLGGLTVKSMFVNNSGFEVGTQTVSVTVGFSVNGADQIVTRDISIKFAERKVVKLSIKEGSKLTTANPIAIYDNFDDIIRTKLTNKVVAAMNDGSSFYLDRNSYSISTLFPTRTELGSDTWTWDFKFNNTEDYEKDIYIRYNFDASIPSLNVGRITVDYVAPYYISDISGVLAKQTVGQPWNLEGLSITFNYTHFVRETTSGGSDNTNASHYADAVNVFTVPLSEIPLEYLRLIKKGEFPQKIEETGTPVVGTSLAEKNEVTQDAVSDPNSYSLQFVYASEADNKMYARSVRSQRVATNPMFSPVLKKSGIGGTTFSSFPNYTQPYTLNVQLNEDDVGSKTYGKPVLDTRAKYLVDVKGKPQDVTLDLALREALGKGEATLKVTVTESNAPTTPIDGIWNASTYQLTFNNTGIFTISFELTGDKWETGKNKISYTVSVAKRELNVTYGSTNSGNVSGNFSEWVSSFGINFSNNDNGAAVNSGLPNFEVRMYAAGSPASSAETIGYGKSGRNSVEWVTAATNKYNNLNGIYFIYTYFEGTDFYNGSEQSAYNVYQINLGSTYEETYQRHSVSKVITEWQSMLNRGGATVGKLYNYDGTKENKVGSVKFENPVASSERLHEGQYVIEYTVTGKTSYDIIIIKPTTYNDLTVSEKITMPYTVEGLTDEKVNLLRTKAQVETDKIYPDLGEEVVIVAGTSITANFSTVTNAGEYQARFATKVNDTEDEAGDYDLPYVYVNFEIEPHVIKSLTLATEKNETTVKYTGSEIAFNLKDENGNWLNIYKDNLTVTMNSATLASDRTINSAFYFVNGRTDGSIQVALAGTYVVTVRFNQNVVSDDREKEKDFTIKVSRAELNVSAPIANGKETITQEFSASRFTLSANQLTYSSDPETTDTEDAAALTSRNFRPLTYNIYKDTTDVSNTSLGVGTYRLVVSAMTANNYRYPRDGGLLADFSYMENYTFAEKEFALTITPTKLKQLEFKTDSNITGDAQKTVTVTYEKDRAWNMLDFFTNAVGVQAYDITVARTSGGNITGTDGTFALDAGRYSVTIDAKAGNGIWDTSTGAGAVTFTLLVEKATIELAVPSIFRGTYNGAVQSALLGGAQSYWKDLKDKGVTAKVIDSAGKESEVNIYTESPLSFGAYSVTNAGVYNIVFSVGATNYAFSGIESSVVGDNCVTTAVQVAEIARMQITAPALETARLTQTGTAHTLPEALQYNATGLTLTQNGITITYNVDYATAGELQDASHTHESFSTSQPDDSKQGVYAIRLTITGNNATNFAWVRNDADVNYISYTNGYDIQGFNGEVDTDRAGAHVAILHYVTVTQKLDITCNTAQSFYYGGYLGNSTTAMNDLAGHMFHYNGTIPTEAEYAYTYVNAAGQKVEAADFKAWDAGAYIGTVNITFPNTEFLPLSFNVAITVEKLPVSLKATGSGEYGSAPKLTEVGYAEGSKTFINLPSQFAEFKGVNITGVTAESNAGTYTGAQYFVLSDDSYFNNYAVTFTTNTTDSEIVVSPKGIDITIQGGESTYGDELTQEVLLGALVYDNNFSKEQILEIISIDLLAKQEPEGRIKANKSGYGIEVKSKSGNYTLILTGTGVWKVATKEAVVTVDLELVYGETVKTGALDGNVKVTVEGLFEGDESYTKGTASYIVEGDYIKYADGFSNDNYHFVDVSVNDDPNLFGKVSYKPLDVTVTIDSVGGEYYKPQVLTYTLTVNSASSYGEGTVELSDTIKEELGGVEGTDGTYTFAMWSQSLGNYLGKPFILSTGAYENYSGEGEGSTANAGTYAIVGMANPEFANRYAFTFVNGSYEVTKVDGSKFTVTADKNYEGKEGEVVIIIKLPGQVKTTTSTDPETRQTAPAKAEIVKAEAQKTTTRRASSLAKTVEEEATPTAEGEPELIELESELTYDEEYHTLAAIEPSTIPDGYVPVYLLAENNEDVPVKSDSRWTSVCPSVIDAGTYTVYIYFKVVNTNYPEISMVRAKVTIKTAKNAIAENGDFKFAKDGIVFSNEANEASAKANAEKTPAWKYGLYAEGAEGGFNILGDHAITEPVTNFTRGAKTSVSLYKTGETDTLVYTASSATALFTYMFNNGTGERFNAGTYKLVFTVSTDPNAKGQQNFDDVTATYYFSVAKRNIIISAAGATVVYGEEATELTATVTGLVRNNYDANETAINPTALYTLTVSGYDAGITDAETTGISVNVALADNVNDLLGGNYNLPTTESGTLRVVKRRVVITIGDKGSTYGDENPNNEFSAKYANTNIAQNIYAPLANHTLVTLKVDVTNNKVTSTTNAGTYPIYAVWNKISESGTDTYEKNYEIEFVNCSYGEKLNVTEATGYDKYNAAGTYTVNKKIIDVEWSATNGSSYVYNGKPREFEAKGVLPESSAPVNLTISYYKNGETTATTTAPINAGEYKVSATFSVTDEHPEYANYTTGGSSITITITRATATVTAKDASVVYGNELSAGTGYGMTIALPEFATDADKAEWNGLADKDQYSSYSVYTDREGRVPYVAGKDVGSYQIVINTDTVKMDNFELVPVAGVFTVTKRNVTVAFKNNLETEYNGKYVTQAYINNTLVKNHENEIFEVTNDWQTPHDWDALGIVLSVENALNAGNYELTATNSSANYNISNIDQLKGTLTIKKKALTVSASATVVYGEELTADKVEFAFDGFVEGENYNSLRAIANAMTSGTKPINGEIGYNAGGENGYSVGMTVTTTPTIKPVVPENLFLNYDVKVYGDAEDESDETKNVVTVTPRELTVSAPADFEYRTEGYSEGLAVLGNIFEGDIENGVSKLAISYRVTKDETPVTPAKLTDVGEYQVKVDLTTSDSDAPNGNYKFADGQTISQAVTVEVVPKAVDVIWQHNVIDLDNPTDDIKITVDGKEIIINYLVGYDASVLDTAKTTLRYYLDGEEVVKPNLGLTAYDDAKKIGVPAEIGEYQLTLTLRSSNYRWLNNGNPESLAYTIGFRANSVVVTITNINLPNDPTYGDKIEATASVENGLPKNVQFTYYKISTKEAYDDFVGKITAGTLTSGDLSGVSEVDVATDAGYYIVKASYSDLDNPNKVAKEKFAAFEIKPLAVSAPVVHGVDSLEYNGSAQVFEVTGFESFMTFTAPDGMVGTTVGNTVRFTATDFNTYNVTFALSDNNHVWANGENPTVTFTVEKSKQTIALNDVYTFAYGDEIEIAPTFKFATDDAVLLYYAYGNADNPQGESLGSTLPSSAGVYYVVVSDNGTDNYDGASKGAIIVVTKKEVKVSITVNVPYGQIVVAGDINYTLTGLVSGETESDYVTVNLAALASGLAFGEGAGIKNVGRYNPVFATAQTVINAYTGATANGLVGFAKRGVADNYYFTADDNSIVIVNKLAVSVVIGNASGTFGSSPQFNSGITLRWADSVGNNNIPAADRTKQDADLMELLGVTASSFYCTANNSSDVGSYPIKVTRWSSDNYNVTFVDGTFEILPANIFVEWTTGGGSYGAVTEPEITKLSVLLNGSLQDVTSTTFGQNAISKLSFLFTDTTGVQLFEAGQIPENAGEYYVELVFAADGKIGQNYTLSLSSAAQRRFSIGKLVIEVEDVRVDYGDDGMKLTYKNGEAVVPTLVANEELNKYFEITRVDDAKTVGTYYMTLTLNDFTNVQWSIGRTAEYRLAFNVTKARNHIVGSIQMEGWTYGDEAKTPSVTLANDKDISDGVEIKPVFEYSANNGADWTTVVPTAAGSYLVRATANGTTNVDAFASPSATPFTIARKAIAKPQIEITMANNTFTGSVLLANVSGFDQSLMMFDYVGNFTVDGNSIALTALNAGTYTLTITLTNSNYMWADNDENLVYEQAWTVAPKRLEKPTEGKNSFVVNGGIITYLPENYDPETMAITGNEEGHGGTFKAEISIIDPANYVWDDGTVDAIQIEWTIVGINTVFKALMGVLGSIAGLAVVGGAAQFVLNKRKQKREAEMDGSEEQTGEESEGGKQA